MDKIVKALGYIADLGRKVIAWFKRRKARKLLDFIKKIDKRKKERVDRINDSTE